MGLPVEVNNLMLGSLGGYTVGRSLRFRSSASAYLNRTPASAGNRKTWTWSGWVKRGQIGVDQTIFNGWDGSNNATGFYFATNDTIAIFSIQISPTTYSLQLDTTQVFRDPSAWYHIVFALDTTQATASNRAKLYVNGVQVTAFSTATYPSQNSDLFVNTNSGQFFGKRSWANTNYFDGYWAEMNFIDGQALTPSSFGAYDTNGVWQPKKYSGTYGTNGFYLPFSLSATSSYAGGFNGSSQSLSGTLASAIGSGNFTIEGWVRQNTLTNYQTWFAITRGAGGFNIGTDASGNLVFYSSSARQIDVAGVMKTNQWQHIAFVRNGTTLTAYLNGIARATATVSTNFSATSFYIGSLDNTQEFLNASMSNLRLTNTAVYTSNFIPSAAPLSAVSGTILLTLQSATVVDNSGNSTSITNTGSVTMSAATPFADPDIAADYSGNVNNWTPNNISLTAGTTYDSMIDSPTNSASSSNYAVLNPLINGSYTTLSGGNLNTSGNTSANNGNSRSSFAFTTGKWYAEFTVTGVNSTYPQYGIMQSSDARSPNNGLPQAGYGSLSNSVAYGADGNKIITYTSSAYGSSYTTNDVIGIAIDADNGAVYFSKNGTFQNSGVPTSGSSKTGAALTWTGGTAELVMTIAEYNGSSSSANFGQRPFSYTPPTGYSALNTYNLPTPTIKNGAQYMAATLYTGNGTSQSINNAVNGVSFQPDFVWYKDRSVARDHALFNVISGATYLMSSNNTSAESAVSGTLTSFNSNGYSIGSAANANANGETYVGWQWKGGGTGVTNNSGTITSTVSASPSSGFSIATFTGTGANATVGHGLGVAPSMIITKQRNATGQWNVYHSSLGNGNVIYLNLTNAANPDNTYWNATSPTANVFTIGTNVNVNTNGTTYVAYCFSAVRGYSAFGSYTGNGSTDGPFVYTGFRPRWIIVKATGEAGGWTIMDTARLGYNASNYTLYAEATTVEQGYLPIDILSNGFKIRLLSTGTSFNTNSINYIYAAFAENPFNYSRAR